MREFFIGEAGRTRRLIRTMQPPIFYRPAFVADPGALFDELLRTVPWDDRMKSRRTASYGEPYNYNHIRYDVMPMHPALVAVARDIADELRFEPNGCLLNYYRDGTNGISYHADTATPLVPGTGVAIVSLGAARTMRYRRKDDHTIKADYVLAAGSLLYMDDAVQHDWEHSIPQQASAGERISLSFRQIVS